MPGPMIEVVHEADMTGAIEIGIEIEIVGEIGIEGILGGEDHIRGIDCYVYELLIEHCYRSRSR